VSAEKREDVVSLFVEATYPSGGIGKALVTRGHAWKDSPGKVWKRVFVGNGNEAVWVFYPRMTVLEQITDMV